jgi:putative GTP pyrophosphokinase
MPDPDALSQLWQQQAHIIRAFLDLQPRYDRLSKEVAYILSKQLDAFGLEYAAITARAKTLNSFCEKIIRKGYKNPLKEITDLAGVRIVYLYLADVVKLEDVIEKEFAIIEKIDKVDKADPDRFGYGALHYLVSLGKTSAGARYDDLRDLVCEIQVRTVLQDAWALVAHHLSYKQESDVPKELRRKLNALAGLFETADDQFDHLRTERQNYKGRVRQELAQQEDKSLKRDIDFDNLTEYLALRLADRGPFSPEEVVDLLSELKEYGYTKLLQIDQALRKASDAIRAYEKKYPPTDLETGEECPYSPIGAVRVALTFTDANYYQKKEPDKDKISEFKYLVKNHEDTEKQKNV